jgi:hypothetical protein
MVERESRDRGIYSTLLYGEGNENHQLGKGYIVHKRSISAVRR